MKKQTFIICLEDRDGLVVGFERWDYKRAVTCVNKMVELYRRWPSLYRSELDKAARVVCYPTPDGYHKEAPVWSVSADEFRGMMKEDAA